MELKEITRLHRSTILRKSWKYTIFDLTELVAFDIRFFKQIINLETDKGRRTFLRKRLRQIKSFSSLLDDYLESLDILADNDVIDSDYEDI